MPVLATITVASLLFGGSDEKASLLSPVSLRPKLHDVLGDADPKLQSTAIALVDHLEKSVADYNESVVSVLDDYAASAMRTYRSPASMAPGFARLDALRESVFSEVIQMRRQLLNLLGPDKWRALFEG